ncbi:MAG: sigma-54 dependent transcriptional regulator [Acidobacteriia bacterium]|nr:sigma-54 dependent transcriptional regulator [Terriglobia bacterium]
MGERRQVLIVDDDQSIGRWLNAVLSAEGYQCQTAHSIEEAEPLLREGAFHLALLDIYLGNANGLEFLKKLKALQPDCNCVMMTAHASVETVARSVAGGALEYLSKPLLIDELLAVVRKLDTSRPSPVLATKESFSPDSAIVGRSPKMLEVYRAIARVAPSTASVLITGASGTGKELVARAIHAHSRRAVEPFTPINCGSFPETILESELFGHEKGAFTGAESSRPGLFEATNGGTLFLDEISETSLSFQVKLLRVVQEQQVRRLGSNSYIPVDVRILAATNKELGPLIRAGQFREDLYYRLSVVTIPLPSLDDRPEDIPLLVAHFLARFNQRNQRQVRIQEGAVRLLTSMKWPGNVRELENLIERLAIFTANEEITADAMEQERARRAATDTGAQDSASTLGGKLEEIERQEILRTLREAKGNKSLAARKLGIERKTLYEKARRLAIDLRSKDA